MIPFKHFLRFNKVKIKTPDPIEAKSLFNKAKLRLEFIKSLDIKEEFSQFIFEEAYETMREASQAIMSLKGYKPYSHEATISFISEQHILFDDEISDFDYYRVLRHDSIYRAINISIKITKDAIKFTELLIKKFNSILDNL